MKELLPGFESEAPLDARSTRSGLFSNAHGPSQLPITPPPLRDHGNYVISINRFVKWLAGKVEEAGITIFTGFAGSSCSTTAIASAACAQTIRRRQAESPKSNFEPGYDVKAKVVVLAEGSRGSLTKQLIEKFDLVKDRNPQTYAWG